MFLPRIADSEDRSRRDDKYYSEDGSDIAEINEKTETYFVHYVKNGSRFCTLFKN